MQDNYRQNDTGEIIESKMTEDKMMLSRMTIDK